MSFNYGKILLRLQGFHNQVKTSVVSKRCTFQNNRFVSYFLQLNSKALHCHAACETNWQSITTEFMPKKTKILQASVREISCGICTNCRKKINS